MNLNYLKEIYPLTSNDVSILSYLDQTIESMNTPSIRQVAKDCYTSPASIVRVAQKLNLSGYNELVYKIKEAHLPTPQQIEDAPSEDEIAAFCHLLAENTHSLLVILGTGFSSQLASFMSEVMNFHQIPNVNTAHTQLLSNQNNQKICFIIVSHSGEDESLKKTIQQAKKQRAPIISFLGNKYSSIAGLSDLVFSTDTYSPFSTNIAQPQLFFGKTLITFEFLICAYINFKRENK